MSTYATSFCPLCRHSVLSDVATDFMTFSHIVSDNKGSWLRHAWRVMNLYVEKKMGPVVDDGSENWRKGIPP